jgi:hypothetical protein
VARLIAVTAAGAVSYNRSMTTEPKSTSSGIREFLFRPNPRKPIPGPKWCGPVALIGMSLIAIPFVFEAVVGSRVLDPSTGQIYQIPFGKGHRYVEYWQYILFEALTIPAMVVFGILAIVLVLYNLMIKTND